MTRWEYSYDVPPLFVYKFTGKERDSESGLDNFGARYDSSSMGRFDLPPGSAHGIIRHQVLLNS